jgi:hypothetical protein
MPNVLKSNITKPYPNLLHHFTWVIKDWYLGYKAKLAVKRFIRGC